jgi:hypothetical protein
VTCAHELNDRGTCRLCGDETCAECSAMVAPDEECECGAGCLHCEACSARVSSINRCAECGADPATGEKRAPAFEDFFGSEKT